MDNPDPEKTPPILYAQDEPHAIKTDLAEKGLDSRSTTSSMLSVRSAPRLSSHSTILPAVRDAEPVDIETAATATPRRDAVKVSQAEKRGLFGRFALVAEVVNPYDYSRKLKWFITFIVAFAAACAPMGSDILLRMIACTMVIEVVAIV